MLSCSAGMLSTNRPHIHSAASWFTWRNQTGEGGVPASSTFPKHSSSYWVPPLPSPFLIFAPALSCVWFTSVLLSIATLFCYQASSQSPLDSVSKQTGKERVQGRGWGRPGWGLWGVDKATSVSDINMAQGQRQYYVYAPSFSASNRVIDPPTTTTLSPSLSPSKSVLCLHSLSLSCYFGWGSSGLAWWGCVFFPLYSVSVGRRLLGAFECFKSGTVESGGGSCVLQV